MSLSDQVSADLTGVFFSLADFAKPHVWTSRGVSTNLLTIEDDDQAMRYREIDGLNEVELVIFVRAEELSPPPQVGSVVLYDKQQMEIANCRQMDGLLEIALQRFG